MIILRFKQTFRDRSSEWILACTLLGWGLITYFVPGMFQTQPFFSSLLPIMTQQSWGITTFLVGATRILFLIINGAWRPSAHIRALGCFLGSIFWSALLVASLGLSWVTPTICIFIALLIMDILSLWFAAGDAKLADIEHKIGV